MKKAQIKISCNTKEYVNSDRFSREKKYDKARLIYNIVISKLIFTKSYKNELDLWKEYDQSFLHQYKLNILRGDYKQFGDLLKNETLKVEFGVLLTSKNKTKKKVVKELMVSDYFVDFIYTYDRLTLYLQALDEYKKTRDEGVKEFLIFEQGKEYSSNEDFRNIRMIIENTQDAIKLLKKDEKKLHKVTPWLNFLEENVGVTVYHMEYGLVSKEVSRIPAFSRTLIDEINSFSKVLEKELIKNPKITKSRWFFKTFKTKSNSFYFISVLNLLKLIYTEALWDIEKENGKVNWLINI